MLKDIYNKVFVIFFTKREVKLMGQEFAFVEHPFLNQLKSIGWEIINHGEHGIPSDPSVSLRNGFDELVLKNIFFEYVKKINVTKQGEEWLTDSQLEHLYHDLHRFSHLPLIEANKEIYKLLCENECRVDRNELTGEEYPVVQLMDFENPKNNHFVAINQFKIETPGKAKHSIIPDITLFVNGLPLVVVECKVTNDHQSDPIEEAIKQLRRYSNQRTDEGVEQNEGEERFFHFNQLMIATKGTKALVGSVTSGYQHYLEWKDIYPEKYKDFETLGDEPNSQETLIQGMLIPETLLDIVRNFTLYTNTGGKTIKIIPRYQQYRAVNKAIERMKEGKSPQERSGVIWHTQGSGKSLTMVFLIKKMRYDNELKRYKVVIINDRTDLEEQLGGTATLTGEDIDKVDKIEKLHEKLGNTSSNIVMAMIHKFQDKSKDKSGLPDHVSFGVVNNSENILILIDEAHRTHNKMLGSNLFEAFPNATRVAFTGTPLIADRHRKKTYDIFGSYIDKYRLQDAVKDGATVKIVYINKTTKLGVLNKEEFDNEFLNIFEDYTEEQRAYIKAKYGTFSDMLESKKVIEQKAVDMVEHYIDNILVDGFKAQVVASSKLAAARYKVALEQGIQKRIENESNVEQKRLLEFLKVGVVLSHDGTNEEPEITEAVKEFKSKNPVGGFKKKINFDDDESGIAILVVCDMLLTGFDAPIEQVMYIDKKMKEHNLLQAIARVNRTYDEKTRGFIVDYVGIGFALSEALELYSKEDQDDIKNAMINIDDETRILEVRAKGLIDYFNQKTKGKFELYLKDDALSTEEKYRILERCVKSLEDVKTRSEFIVHYKHFLTSMNIIIPHPNANPYYKLLKVLGYIHNEAKDRYSDGSIKVLGVGNKVKKLIHDYLISEGIFVRGEPVDLLSNDFQEQIDKQKKYGSKASHMKHKMRYHIQIHMNENPGLYKKLSEKLEDIIKRYEDGSEEQYQALLRLFEEFKTDELVSEYNLNPKTEMKYYLLLLHYIEEKEGVILETKKESIATMTREIVEIIKTEISMVGFWDTPKRQTDLKTKIEIILRRNHNVSMVFFDKKENIANEFMNLTKVNKEVF